MKKIKTKSVQLKDSEKLNGNLILNVEEISDNIQKHIDEIKRWAYIIKFSDLDRKKTLGSIYIQLEHILTACKETYKFNRKRQKNFFGKSSS